MTLGHVNSRNRREAYEFLVREFRKSGISQSELAIRTGKTTVQISRLLGRPSNMTIDTMSALLFAMSGRKICYASGDSFGRTAEKRERGQQMESPAPAPKPGPRLIQHGRSNEPKHRPNLEQNPSAEADAFTGVTARIKIRASARTTDSIVLIRKGRGANPAAS